MLTFSKKFEALSGQRGIGRKKLAERARRYVEKMPSALSGQGGHDATFAVAVALIHGFALDEAEAWPILCDFNKRAVPAWNERELKHKLADAGKLARHSKPRGHLAGGTRERATHFIKPPPPSQRETWDLKPESLPPKQCEPEPTGTPEPHDEAEARRIAGELARAHRDGVLPADEHGRKLIATAIHLFDASYIPANEEPGE